MPVRMQGQQDACGCRKSVLEAAAPAFYEHMLLKPYVVFDVSHGREQRGGASGGSLRNEARSPELNQTPPTQTWRA